MSSSRPPDKTVGQSWRSQAAAHEPGRVAIPLWAELVTRLLDNAFVIPGTEIRVGLDPILGLIAPGAGDAVGALAALSLLYLGFKLRVPRVILWRMLLNVAVDALIGAIPLLGDTFDIFFRAGERNLELLRKHAGLAAERPGLADYAVVGFAALCALLFLALPVVLALAGIHLLVKLSSG